MTDHERELNKTHQRVLYILKTQMTIPADVDPDDAIAWKLTHHIHDNFVLKDGEAGKR